MDPIQFPTLYLAGPLFSEADRRYNLHLKETLERAGFRVYLPQLAGETAPHRSPEEDRALFLRHRNALDESDMVVANCDGPDTDSGTAWEMGYAVARGKPVFALRTDHRYLDDHRRINLMLAESARLATSLEELLRVLSSGRN